MPSASVIRRRAVELAWGGGAVALAGFIAVSAAWSQVATLRKDFSAPGTQPNEMVEALPSVHLCGACHSAYNPDHAPFDSWSHSLMAQSARDPVFFAALSIAEKDAPFAGDYCLRCHSPVGWLQGHVQQTDGTALIDNDLDGVACIVCHRMVDPDHTPGVDPAVDATILANLTTPVPVNPGNANYVIDPLDRRRGPYDLDADWAIHNPPEPPFNPGGWPDYHEFLQSPFHRTSGVCATCHDVSNPNFTKQPDGTYALNPTNQSHPTGNKYDMFPEQRTFSEWSASLFAQGPVDLDGRFGGTMTAVSTCQDCHMPQETTEACALTPPLRPQNKLHHFNGANSWVLRAIKNTYFDSETSLSDEGVALAEARTRSMMERASDLQLFTDASTLTTRIINFTGHKLPTGYNEGRRMWINVKFFNEADALVQERGGYNAATATLDEATTKVYESKLGITPDLAGTVGQPAGETFHLVFANTVLKDNRIPPMGFANAAFQAVQAGHTPPGQYADGQYWDDVDFPVPAGAVRAEVRVYHETTSREYAEFLRDAQDPLNALAVSRGNLAFNLWNTYGKGTITLMDQAEITLGCPCDFNGQNGVTVQDIYDFLSAWSSGQASADFNGQNGVTVQDIYDFLSCWSSACQ